MPFVQDASAEYMSINFFISGLPMLSRISTGHSSAAVEIHGKQHYDFILKYFIEGLLIALVMVPTVSVMVPR